MDKTTRFTLREIYEAAAAYQPELVYRNLYFRFNKLKKAGILPESATVNNLTWEQGRMILQRPARVHQDKPRQEAVAILRQQMRNDGLA